jgi:hypothetical protein
VNETQVLVERFEAIMECPVGFEPTTPGLKVRLPRLYITYARPIQTDSVSGIGAHDAAKTVAIGANAPTSGDKMATELSTNG